MGWEAAAVLIAAILGISAPLTAKMNRRRSMSGQEMSPQQELHLTEKIDRIQSDVNALEIDMAKVQKDTEQAAREIGSIHQELKDLRQMITNYILGRKTQ